MSQIFISIENVSILSKKVIFSIINKLPFHEHEISGLQTFPSIISNGHKHIYDH